MCAMKYADPAPSLLRYRFERLWLKPSVRRTVRLWLPLAVVAGGIWMAAHNPAVQGATQQGWNALRDTVAARPELQVDTLEFPDVSPDLQAQIQALVPLDLPKSAIDLKVADIKAAIETLDAVKQAEVRITGNGTLEIRALERRPVLVWRDGNTLRLVDETGHKVAELARRNARPDLPLIAGKGADAAVAEAMKLFETATPIAARLRGFVRVGERRWDVVLDRGQTIMLPENGAITALRHVLELHKADDLLNRDIIVVDMRNPDRPVLRLTETAIEELRRLRAKVRGEDA